jgi:hypothetical protein
VKTKPTKNFRNRFASIDLVTGLWFMRGRMRGGHSDEIPQSVHWFPSFLEPFLPPFYRHFPVPLPLSDTSGATDKELE